MEKIIETVTIEGVDFTIIEKPKTLYAGFHSVAPNIEGEPDFEDAYKRFQEKHSKIIDSTVPECMICFSIGYTEWNRTRDVIREGMFGRETTNPNQAEGIKVIEAPPCLLIRVKVTNESWNLVEKIMGEKLMPHFFGTMGNLFFTPERRFTNDGDLEMEYHYSDGTKYAAIPVKKY